MLFISPTVDIHISNIWNIFWCQNWLYYCPNSLLVKQFTFRSQVDSISKNWWNHKVAMLSSNMNILNWNGKKMNPKQFYIISVHLQLMWTCFSTMLCYLKQIKICDLKYVKINNILVPTQRITHCNWASKG